MDSAVIVTGKLKMPLGQFAGPVSLKSVKTHTVESGSTSRHTASANSHNCQEKSIRFCIKIYCHNVKLQRHGNYEKPTFLIVFWVSYTFETTTEIVQYTEHSTRLDYTLVII